MIKLSCNKSPSQLLISTKDFELLDNKCILSINKSIKICS